MHLQDETHLQFICNYRLITGPIPVYIKGFMCIYLHVRYWILTFLLRMRIWPNQPFITFNARLLPIIEEIVRGKDYEILWKLFKIL